MRISLLDRVVGAAFFLFSTVCMGGGAVLIWGAGDTMGSMVGNCFMSALLAFLAVCSLVMTYGAAKGKC